MAEVFELINDIGLSYDGDLIIDDTNDLRIISGPDWFKREVNKLLRTRINEWKSEPDIGLNLEDNIGRTNSKDTADDIRKKIKDALTIDNFQFPGDFEIKIVPVLIDEFVIYITYNIIGEVLPIGKLIYNLKNGISLHIYDELEEERIPYKKQHKQETKNKYLRSLMK